MPQHVTLSLLPLNQKKPNNWYTKNNIDPDDGRQSRTFEAHTDAQAGNPILFSYKYGTTFPLVIKGIYYIQSKEIQKNIY